MTTTHTTDSPVLFAEASSDHGVTLARVIRSEWIKLRSVRSTVVTLVLVAVAVAGAGVLVSMLSSGNAIGADNGALADAAGNSLFGTMIAQLVLGVLGALVFTSEYSTGMIRATFSAVPKRLPVLWAKVLVLGATTFATMVAAVAVAFFLGQALYGGAGAGASVFDPGVARAILGAALFPTAIAVMGVALGVLMRHTAMTVGVLVGFLFVVPVLLEGLGGIWADAVAYLPGEAGQATITLVPDAGQLSPLAGFGVLALWVGGLLVAAATVLQRRDA